MRANNTTVAVYLVLGLAGAAARAQLVTQPPRHVLGPEDRISIVQRPKEHGGMVNPPDPAPLKSLIERDTAGRLVPLKEPAEWAALRINPLISDTDRALIEPVLVERRRAVERIAIDNLDLVEQIEGGLFETINLANNKAFAQLLDVARPLHPSDIQSLSRTLMSKELLNKQQASQNDTIVHEYRLAVVSQAVNAQAQGAGARRAIVLLYKQGLDEPLMQVRHVRLEAARRLTTLAPTLGLDKPTTDSLLEAAGKPDARASEDALLAALGRVNAKLTLDQRKELLRHVAAQR